MDTITEDKVYKRYRSALRAQHGGHAASRRQNARAAVVKKHGISYADLKDLVARHDAAHGITHEHTAEYTRSVELLKAQEAYNENPVPCSSCGSNDTVRPRWNPFLAAVYAQFEIAVLCFECHMTLEFDI
jgi:hypothetical protein